MNKIKAAELRYYNANDRNNRTGDCVLRSLTIAYGLRYEDVHKDMLTLAGKGNSYRMLWVVRQFIKLHGFVQHIDVPEKDRTYVDDFADQHSQGTYIVITGKKPNTNVDHMICIENGKVWDSWDSLHQYVYQYWIIREGSDVLEDHPGPTMDTLSYVSDQLTAYCEKLMKKTPWANIYVDEDYTYLFKDGYTMNVDIEFETNDQYGAIFQDLLSLPSWKRNYLNTSFSKTLHLILKFNPKRDYQENLEVTLSRAKVKLREWAYQIRKFVEDENNKQKISYHESFTGDRNLLLKMPEWARPLIRYARYEGQWAIDHHYERYHLKMDRLPDDPRNGPNDEIVDFYADTIPELRSYLDWYKKEFKRINYDY